MNTENIVSIGATIGGGFFIGLLIGYALKKVVKLVAVVVGLFLVGITYLQYQEIVNVNWTNFKQYLRILCQQLQMQLLRFLVLAAIIVQEL